MGHRAVVLTSLVGVGWPMASSILTALYPCHATVLDFRAVEMLDGDRKISRYATVKGYNRFCHRVSELANKYNVDLRTLDRALWQLSSEGKSKH